MLAIKDGKDGESKLKKYDPFENKVSSTNGVLDISNLVPTETGQETTPTTSPISQASQVEPLVIPVSTNLAQPFKQDLSPPYGTTTPPDSALYEETPNLVSNSLESVYCQYTSSVYCTAGVVILSVY